MIDGAHPAEETIRRVLKLLPERITRDQLSTVLKLTTTNRRELGSCIRVLAQAGAVQIEGKAPEGLVTVLARSVSASALEPARIARERELVRLRRMQSYAYHTGCRRAFVMDYFGQHFSRRDCAGCDNCTNWRHEQIDGRHSASSSRAVHADWIRKIYGGRNKRG